MFLQQTKQVVLTYLTQRWPVLLMSGSFLFVILLSYATLFGGEKGAEPLQINFGLGMPIMMGSMWLLSIAKWQFANPRARLLPGFVGPHLGVLAAIFFLLLLLHPICLSMAGGLSTAGTLAFALLLSGTILWGTQHGRGLLMLPAMAIFFSSMSSIGRQFWFAIPNHFAALHGMMAVAGGAMVIAWFWRLARLDEEMDDYQILPMGTPGGLSRLERAEQRKLQGRVSDRRNPLQALADRWHDRLPHLSARKDLLQYGFGRIPGFASAILAGLGFAAYGIFLNQLSFGRGDHMVTMAIQFATAGPAVVTGLRMIQRLPRMAQELLRPATRAEYFDGLQMALAKQAGWLWLALQIGLLAMVVLMDAFPDENLPSLVGPYLIISLATQVPAFAFSFWLVRKYSMWRLLLGLYGVMGIYMAVLSAWWFGRKEWGDLLVVSLLVTLLLAAGAKMLAWSRHAWLQQELG